MSGTLKNVGTTAIRGLSHIPGFVGDLSEFAGALGEVPDYAQSKITGEPFAAINARHRAAAEDFRQKQVAIDKGIFGFSTDPRSYFPSGSEVAAPILQRTGAYQPTSGPGRYGSAAGEAVLGGLGPGGGAVLKGLAENAVPGVLAGATRMAQDAAQHAPVNAVAGISSQAASDASGGDPLAAALGGIGATTALGAAHGIVAGRPVRKAASVLAQGTNDPQAALAAIRNQPDAIPGVDPTTAQVTNDLGIQAMQSAAAGTRARGPQFDARQQQQSRGLGNALDALKPGGDPQAVATFFSQHFDDIGDRTQSIIDGHLSTAQTQADALRGQGLPVDAYGATLRGHLVDADAARRGAEGELWDAVDPDGKLTNDAAGIKAANAQIYGQMPAADRAFMSPAEQTFAGLINGYNDVEPFRQVASLKSNLASAMRQELRDNGSTPAYGRMSRLMAPVQDALNGTVARKAAADNAAVAAGTLAPEDTLAAKLDNLLDKNERQAQQDTGAGVGRASVAAAAGASPGLPGTGRTAGEGNQRSGAVPRPQAVQSDVAGASPQVGEVAAPTGGIVAYHGSPYDFDTFDGAAKTENAKAYGSGHYTATDEGVGKYWRDVLEPVQKGTLYQLHIAREPSEFLDHQRPLSEAAPKVQQAVKTVLPDARPTDTGADIYDRIQARHQTDPAGASRLLHEQGVAGIKYVDRDSGSKNPNYVTFHDNDIRITHKNGVALPQPAPPHDGMRTPASMRAGDAGGQAQGLPRLDVVAPGAVRPVYHPGGTLGVRNELAEHSELITSHDADFRPRADYPQNLQPRARESAGARDQVNGMAARLNPERLGPSPEANAGAPIVGPDNVVESGNGRTMAIGKAYDAGGAQADAYRAHLEKLGYDTSGFAKPVLVGRRVTPMTPDAREFFTHAANDATALRMGSAEQAAADASKITPSMLDGQAGPNITAAANRPFVGSFMSKLPAAERGALVDGAGNLSQAGVRRIQAAMAAHAYGDRGVISRAFDDAEPNIKGLAGALTDAAGPWAKMRNAVSDGSISPEHDVTPELMQGVKLAMRARDEGRPIGELLAQRDLFQGDTSRLVTAMLTKDGNRLASRPEIEANLRTYAEEALKNSSADGLFGGAAPVDDVLKAAQARAARETGSQTSRMVDGPVFSDVPPPPTATMDATAAARYRAANDFTKESHSIYGAKPIAGILAEQGGRGNYKTPASAVPGQLFGKGPAGFEHVQAFRRAVGDDGAAMHLLRDHALDDVQRVAHKPDGTLDEAKLAKWRTEHADALRAYPELATQLESAGAATRTFTEASAQRRDLIKSYEKSVFGKLMGASHPDEVTGIIGQALQRNDRVNVFRKITAQAQNDPVALAGLRQAVLEHVVGKSVADIESETGAARTLKAKQFLDVFRKTEPALREVLGGKTTGMLQRIAEIAPRASQAIEGAGKTPKKLMRYLETAAKPHESLLERMWKPALVMREFGELGGTLGGEWGEMLAGGVGAAAVGKRLVTSIRATGARKVGDLITDALLDPEKYAALMAQAPKHPDTGSASTLAYQLRRASMYGGNAAARVATHLATRAPRFADRADDQRRQHAEQKPARARGGGLLGMGKGVGPLGVPTFGQMLGPGLKAAKAPFATGGAVGQERPEATAERFMSALQAMSAEMKRGTQEWAILASLGHDPAADALRVASSYR